MGTILSAVAGYKTHLLVAGAIAKAFLDFTSGDIALGELVNAIMQDLMVSTFKAGVDRGLA